MVTGYAHKKKAKKVLGVFTQGCGGTVVTDVSRPAMQRFSGLADGPAAFYGIGPTNVHLWQAVQQQGREYYWLDNGYFPQCGRYAVTRNALQATGRTRVRDEQRMHELGVRILPWRRDGRKILVCLQSELFFSLMFQMNRTAWVDQVTATLRRYTDRPIVVREKPARTDASCLSAALRECYAVVVHSSKAAVQALCEGIPVFALAPCAAAAMACDDLSKIETPVYPDGREAWAASLACRQWTLEEMRSGQCWGELQTMERET